MGKFYVQSGTLRTVVQAESSRKAAIWAVHQALQQVLPLEERRGDRVSSAEHEPRIVLDTVVHVNERGFDRDDSRQQPTFEVIAEWNQMISTLDRLEKMLYQAP